MGGLPFGGMYMPGDRPRWINVAFRWARRLSQMRFWVHTVGKGVDAMRKNDCLWWHHGFDPSGEGLVWHCSRHGGVVRNGSYAMPDFPCPEAPAGLGRTLLVLAVVIGLLAGGTILLILGVSC